MILRTATRHAFAIASVVSLVGCAMLGGSDPDQAQRDAWRDAVAQANPRFTDVAVDGTRKDGFTSYTYVSVTLDSASIAEDDVQDLIDAIGTSTEDSHRGHQIRADFAVVDPDTPSGIALIDLTEAADASMVFGTGTLLSFPAGGES